MRDSVGANDKQRVERNLAELIPLALAVASIAWLGSTAVRPFAFGSARFSERAKFIAAQISSPGMGFFVLLTVLACVYVPPRDRSRAALRTRRAATALGAFASLCIGAGALWTIWTSAVHVHIPGPGANDSLNFSLTQDGTAERISMGLYCIAALLLASLALALAVQLLRRSDVSGGDNDETAATTPDRLTDSSAT